MRASLAGEIGNFGGRDDFGVEEVIWFHHWEKVRDFLDSREEYAGHF